MAKPFDLSKLLENVARRMDAEVREAKFIGPSVEIGTRREEILLEFLRRYLPRRYYVGTGIIISPLGGSDQQDLVIFDEVDHQRLPQTTVGSIFPAEGVVGTIQVKSSLTKDELESAVHNIRSAKALFKESKHRPFGVVFAYECSNAKNRRNQLQAVNEEYVDDYLVVDRIYVPNITVMSYFDREKMLMLHARTGYSLENRNYGRANMIHFYRYLLGCLSNPPKEHFDIAAYLDDDYFDEARKKAANPD
jgi:hypothetical protein